MHPEIFKEAENRLAAMQIQEALRLFDQAERQGGDPDSCGAGRWTCHMMAGDFSKAWQESAGITCRGNPDPHRYWDGKPVDRRNIIVRCLHGLGDTIQFIRYAPLVRARAGSLTVEAQPPLQPLLAGSGLADCVITWTDSPPPWDQQIEVIELPRIFNTTLDSIPNEVPYLKVAPASLRSSFRRAHALRVGLVWAGSRYNGARSIPLREMARLFSLRDISFFTLQAGPERFEIEPWMDRVTCLHDETAAVLSTARYLEALDLVITVDTMMAHLAGALARPVWTLLPFSCDWRWMLDREDSPWYPTMRLFRQPRPGDWRSVIDRVCAELEALARDSGSLSLSRLAGQREKEARSRA